MAVDDNQIASGWNNAAGLVNIETLVDSNGVYVAPLLYGGLGNYTRGLRRVGSDGVVYYEGYAVKVWTSVFLTYLQYDVVLAYSGKVTLRTRLNSGSYANYNAVLTLPDTSELNGGIGYYRDVTWTFTRLEAL